MKERETTTYRPAVKEKEMKDAADVNAIVMRCLSRSCDDRIRELDRQVEENAKLGRELWDLACRKVKEADAALAENERLREALSKISSGDGVYGAQAHEYKQIARAALKGDSNDA